MKEYVALNGVKHPCWILRTSIVRHLMHRADTLIDHQGIIEWVDHRSLVDMRGRDWSKLKNIIGWCGWSVFWLAMLAAMFVPGWIQYTYL